MAWVIDSAHTTIEFTAKHMMIATVRGRFSKFSGTIELDEKNLLNTKIEGTIDATSLTTNEPNRDGHLSSPDFFDVAKYPTITFKSTRIEAVGKGEFKLHGNLTIKDVAKEIVLNVTDEGSAVSPSAMGSVAKHAFSAEAKINRKDWGLNWNVALEAGGWLVSEDVKIHIEAELTRVPEAQTADAAKA